MLQPNVTEPDLAVDASAIKRYIRVLWHFNALLLVNSKEYLFIRIFAISLVKLYFRSTVASVVISFQIILTLLWFVFLCLLTRLYRPGRHIFIQLCARNQIWC